MMNHCAIQQKNAYVPCEDMRRDYVICPKPRRAGRFNSSVRPAGWHFSHQADVYDSKDGTELLDIILSKGGGQENEQTYTSLASSPPFFSGSPPVRVSNPIVHDDRFVEVKQQASLTSSTYMQNPTLNLGVTTSPSSSTRKGGFARNNFGNNPAVRVEGFEALDRDHRNCSISTLA